MKQQGQAAAMTTHWLHQFPMVGIDKYAIICHSKSGQPITQNLHPEFLFTFLEAMGEELVVMLASTRDTANIKKPIISLYCNNTVIQKPQIAILD
jgi:hypothetical protein